MITRKWSVVKRANGIQQMFHFWDDRVGQKKKLFPVTVPIQVNLSHLPIPTVIRTITGLSWHIMILVQISLNQKKKITSSGISPEVATKNRVCSLCFHHPSASILPSSPQEMPPPPRKPDLDRQGDCRKKPDLATSEHYAAKDPIGRT